MSTMLSRLGMGILLMALAFIGGACSRDAGSPVGASKPVVASVPVAEPGTTHEVTGWKGSGFVARLRLARGIPDRSGESTVAVRVAILPNGRYLKSRHLSLVGCDQPSLVLAAVTPTGTTDIGASHPGEGAFSPAPYVEFDFGGDYRLLPAEATAVRVTLHLGESMQKASEGTSVTVPVSAIPALADLGSIEPRHGGAR